jgi:hypothetical protein
MTKVDAMTLDDILDQVMLEESEPSNEALKRWCKKFPEHRDALGRFFATWAVQNERPNTVRLNEDRIAKRLVSYALNLVHKQEAARVTATQAASQTSLCKLIKSSGLTEEEVASKCGLDELLLMKLDRRLIRFKSIPSVLFECVANVLRCSAELVRQVLIGDPIPLGAYKAKKKPAVKVEEFADAVRTSRLSDEKKAEWIRLTEEEAAKGDGNKGED